jgi:phage gp36-like protein
MSSYAQISDLQNLLTAQKLIDLCDFAGTGLFDTAATARAQAALDLTAAAIDSYCGGRYKLPLQVSVQLADMNANMAAHKLYVGRQRAIPETVKDANAAALKFLADVSSKKASLDQATITQTTEMNTVTAGDRREAFSDRKLRAF